MRGLHLFKLFKKCLLSSKYYMDVLTLGALGEGRHRYYLHGKEVSAEEYYSSWSEIENNKCTN